jgi:hypothetical protein
MDPIDFEALRLLIAHFDGKEVYLRTVSSYPEFIHGRIKKEGKNEGHYSLDLPNRRIDTRYSEFLEMYVP